MEIPIRKMEMISMMKLIAAINLIPSPLSAMKKINPSMTILSMLSDNTNLKNKPPRKLKEIKLAWRPLEYSLQLQ